MRFLTTLLVVLGATAGTPAGEHDAFDAILRERVTDGLVDYAAIKQHDADDLKAYLDARAAVDVSKRPRNEQLAHYINLYNATMIRAVITELPEGSSPDTKGFAIFKRPRIHLSEGDNVSLDHLEHEIIRKQFRDPRIHVALVCAAKSCPPLLSRAYRAEDLDKVLDENMRRFVNDRARNQVDHEKKELRLSKIFDWYADDFGGREQVPAYVGKVLGQDLTGYRVSFLEYDWSLNAVPAK
jgi:hypothetical protein